jgi:small subunit ribosomal protein S4
MGDPRKIKNKFKKPGHPWNKARIEKEKGLTYTYGLTNKKELWKVDSKLKTYKDNIKKLIAQQNSQAEKELEQLFKKLQRHGLIAQGNVSIDDVLGLQIEQLLDRRLQTIVLKHELARSIKQARQFITHGHILIGGKKVTVPGYLVTLGEEHNISFSANSSLFNVSHPERVVQKKSTGAGSKRDVKSKAEQNKEPLPVTETDTNEDAQKPIEELIEEDTNNAKEIEEAVTEAEADDIAKEHEQNVRASAQKSRKKKGDAS